MDQPSHQTKTRLHEMLHHPLTLPGYIPSLVLAFSQGMLAPILPLYVTDFGISYGLVGLVLAGDGIGALLGDLPAGQFLRRLGSKRSMLLGFTCSIASTAALFWARSVPLVLACRLLTGFGGALYAIARHTFVADNIPVPGRGKVIALLGGLFRFGRFVGPAIGGTVAAVYGLRMPFLLYSVICVMALVSIAASADTGQGPQPDGSIRPGGTRFLDTISNHRRQLLTAGSGQFFAQMVRAGRRTLIPLYASEVLGLDPQAIGLIESVSSAVDTALFYPTGLIMDRWGRKFAIVPSFLFQAVGLVFVPFTSGFAELLLVTAVLGFGNGLGSGTMMTMGADLSPQNGRAQFLGVWRLIGDAGVMGGPLVVGAVADLIALPAAAWAAAVSGLAAASVFAFLVPETLHRQELDT